MENVTLVTPLKQPIVFELEGFFVPPDYSSLLFFLALFNYMVVLLGNGVVLCVIVIDKNLHRPMFLLVCNLVVCDLLGATAVLPRLMMHFLTGQKRIPYILAIAQAFCVHTYGVAVQTILGAMAYDRYIAVCEPLRYHAIMTSARLHFCCALAWLIALLCLSMTWSLSTGVFLIIAFSYIRILHASVKQGRSDSGARSKAFQTCAPHLVVYLLFEIASVIIIVSHRFPSLSQNIKKFFSILFVIIPPAINPIIYGLVSKELRGSIIKHFTSQACRKK
eukprot:superscaffoldBa00005963_g20983